MSYEKWLENNKPKFGHSNSYYIDGEGGKHYQVDEYCYANMFWAKEGLQEARIFFNTKAFDHWGHYARELFDFCLSENLFGPNIFLNPSVEHGLENGFELNLDKPKSLVKSFAQTARFVHECYYYKYGINKDYLFTYPNFRELGFDVKESYILCINFQTNSRKTYIPSKFNTNHLIWNGNARPCDLSFDNYIVDENEKTFLEGVSYNRNLTNSWRKTGWEICRLNKKFSNSYEYWREVLDNQEKEKV